MGTLPRPPAGEPPGLGRWYEGCLSHRAVFFAVEGGRLTALALAALLAACPGCFVHHERGAPRDRAPPPGRDPMDAGPRDVPGDRSDADARPRSPELDGGRGDTGPPRPLACDAAQGVDLLIVLDDSGSLRPADDAVRDRLQRMLRELVRPLDLDGDGWEDWPRVNDLQVGVVTTSATGPRFCAHAADGALMRGAPADLPFCRDAPYPPITRYVEGGSVERLLEDVACVGFGARDGCQVEQPLEAMAKALLPTRSPFTFASGRARGDRENAGFLRPDSVLVVLVLANEDDCSVYDPSAFDPPDGGLVDAGPVIPPFFDAGPPGSVFACELRGEALHTTDRYVEVLRWLRPDPERLVVGVIAGIREAVVIAPRPGEFYGTCRRAHGYPLRLVQLAQSLEDRAVLGSICGIGEMRVVRAMAERIADAACGE